MAWNGPVAGAASYQARSYANGEPGPGNLPPYQCGQPPTYGQYQHGPPYSGTPQRPQDSRPPKKKGNPIITRYPPPPGYRGPAQPQGPFHGSQHSTRYQQPLQPNFPQVPPGSSTHLGRDYAAPLPQQGCPPRNYRPPQASSLSSLYTKRPSHEWPQATYQTNQGPLQTPAHPAALSYVTSQAAHSSYPAHTAALNSSTQMYDQASGWQKTSAEPKRQQQSQHNVYSGQAFSDQVMADPSATPTPATAHLGSAPSASSKLHIGVSRDSTMDRKSELYLAWDDWDFDFDGAIWPKSNEPVDPNLSLGVIIWHPAKQVTRALPATFREAEDQSLKPTPEKLGNGESVSIYFTAENSHEAFLDVRQTDDWDFIKDDPAFVLFKDEDMQNNLIPIEDCIAQRDRSDEPVEWNTQTEDTEMCEADWSVMDNLERALSASGQEPRPHEQQLGKTQTQEDILTSLGVTGLPKPVSEEAVTHPMPSKDVRSAVPPPTEGHSSSLLSASDKPGLNSLTMPAGSISVSQPQVGPLKGHATSMASASDNYTAAQRSYGSNASSSIGLPPPPPPPPEQDRYDPWHPSYHRQQCLTNGFDGGRGSPARSEASNGTAAGSDFENEKTAETHDFARTPGSKLERTDSSVSRKRSYGDTGTDDDGTREKDDHTKRKRRSLIDAAYGRR